MKAEVAIIMVNYYDNLSLIIASYCNTCINKLKMHFLLIKVKTCASIGNFCMTDQ